MKSPLTIALVHDAKLPVVGYGGTERVVTWLAKGLHELGVSVVLAAKAGSTSDYARIANPDFSKPIEPQIDGVDLFHHFVSPGYVPEHPHLVTIEGNGKEGETFLPNTAFVSRNHAQRHGAECFVYNGVDPAEYIFQDKKKDYLLFLAKAAWKVKNVRGAIRYARRSHHELRILGGKRWYLNHWRGIHWEGMLGGTEKARWIAGAKGLIFPVQWNEPFGLAVIEALLSGTPVLASPHGSLPELVPRHVGSICTSDQEFVEGISRLSEIKPADCREWAAENFHYRAMARSYVTLYEKVLRGEALNTRVPRASEPPQKFCPIRE